MEPRIDHGRPGWLGAWLQDRCHQGLGVPEAECLCLRMYYRFDGIPMALRPQLSRVTLPAPSLSSRVEVGFAPPMVPPVTTC